MTNRILLDTNFLYALNDADDTNHVASATFLQTLDASLFLPSPVLPELSYLLHSRLGHLAMRRFLLGLEESDIVLVSLTPNDLMRINQIQAKYADARLDFADTAIVAMAERLEIERICTFDRRDFSIIRPKHTTSFTLLP